MIGGLLLALVSAGLINIGFLLQHRGLRHGPSGSTAVRLRRALRDRVWLSGQALGWLGFGTQIVAVAIAPLSLVQAFAAGGLALSVPIAAGLFGHHITRTQGLAVGIIAAGLAVLPIGFQTARDHLAPGALAAAVVIGGLVALAVAALRAPGARSIAAGIFYGLADAAIKAVALGWRAHGAAALGSGWTAVAAAGTFAGFLTFQSALLRDGPVAAISLMNGLAAVTALVLGLTAFGESLGAGPAVAAAHLVAIAIVLAGVPVLAVAQTAIVQSAEPAENRTAGADAVPVAQRAR